MRFLRSFCRAAGFVGLLFSPTILRANHAFDFSCRSDTVLHVQPGEFSEFHFTLANTGSEDDVYEFDLAVLDSVSGWVAIYCVGGICAEPGLLVYDTLAAGTVDTSITVTIYTGSSNGEEVTRLRVRSLAEPSLADSITTRTVVGSGVGETPDASLRVTAGLRVFPNPVPRGGPITVAANVPAGMRFSLSLFDVHGRRIDCRPADVHSARRIEITPDRNLPAGVYLLRLHAGPVWVFTKVILE